MSTALDSPCCAGGCDDDAEAKHEHEQRRLGREHELLDRWPRPRLQDERAAAATHTGAIPSAELRTKPASVAARTHRAKTGSSTAGGCARPVAECRSSDENDPVKTSHSIASATSQGSAISPPNRANGSPLA